MVFGHGDLINNIRLRAQRQCKSVRLKSKGPNSPTRAALLNWSRRKAECYRLRHCARKIRAGAPANLLANHDEICHRSKRVFSFAADPTGRRMREILKTDPSGKPVSAATLRQLIPFLPTRPLRFSAAKALEAVRTSRRQLSPRPDLLGHQIEIFIMSAASDGLCQIRTGGFERRQPDFPIDN